MILISACLVGVNCKYNGGNNWQEKFLPLLKAGQLLPVCPEQLGGLPTPRPPAEIIPGTGKVFTHQLQDVTSFFARGAAETLQLARRVGAKRAIFKERSPSCGVHQIYDGTFSNKVIKGQGMTTALLVANGILVLSDEEQQIIK